MTITNYKIKEFVTQESELVQEYLSVLKFLKPSSSIKFKERFIINKDISTEPLNTKSYGVVEKIKMKLENGSFSNLIECVKLMFGLNENQIINLRITQFYAGLNYVISEAERLITNENTVFESEPDLDLQSAGADSLKAFKVFPTIYELAGGNPLNFEKIEALQYDIVFTTLAYKNIKAKVEKKYYEIKSKRNGS